MKVDIDFINEICKRYYQENKDNEDRIPTDDLAMALSVFVYKWDQDGLNPTLDHYDAIISTAEVTYRVLEDLMREQGSTEYYRGLVERCGKAVGVRAYTDDDGVVHQDVLNAKVPEIIEEDYSQGYVTVQDVVNAVREGLNPPD